jgi:hypothetical protein
LELIVYWVYLIPMVLWKHTLYSIPDINNPPQQSSILAPMALHNREFPVHRNEVKVKKGAIGELSMEKT